MTVLDDNIKKLEKYLAPIKEKGILNNINGEAVGSVSNITFENSSPVDESFVCNVSRSNVEDINNASLAAKKAFSDWAKTAPAEKKKILHRIADGIVERAEEIAFCECWDTGQALRFMSKAAIRGSENFRFFADKTISARDGLSLPSSTLLNITSRVPIGPVGIITPWNTPFMLSTWKIAPALAAGCTIVHKPAELSPVTAQILNEIANQSGLPPGVWNLVNGFGEEAGVALSQNKDIKAIAFVGESRTGSAIMKQGADTLKRVHFELGGKNPVVVFDDADFDRALDAAIFMIYSLNGERCTSSSRLIIQKNISDKFINELIKRVKKIKVGHPLDPSVEVGPLISEDHHKKVTSYFEIAREEGAKIAVGGNSPNGSGWFVNPTLFDQAKPKMRIAQEEIFGPVLTAITFENEEEALEIANGTEYGLTGYIWTNDLTRALRFSENLEAGMIWVNSENVRHLPTPFGGVKASGIGRDGGDWSFDFYMEQKHIGLATGFHSIPKLGK